MENGGISMGNTLWFITILKDQPWIGFLIGLVFLVFMFGSKNLVVYLYSRSQEKKIQSAGVGKPVEKTLNTK